MKWRTIVKNQKFAFASTAVISVSAGIGVGILASVEVLEKRFQERLSKEIEEARIYYQEMYNTPTLVAEHPSDSEEDLLEIVRTSAQENDGPPEDLVGKALDAVREYSPSDEDEHGRRAPVIVNNIFQDRTPPGDEVLGALLAQRDPSAPYIITREEFLQNEPDHEQLKFTYWEGDDVLVDDREEFNPINDTERVAGDDNLLHFGYGSGDEHVVYIRNEAVDPPFDLHVTRSTGKYAHEVMGDMDEDSTHLQHSQPRKFRIYDE